MVRRETTLTALNVGKSVPVASSLSRSSSLVNSSRSAPKTSSDADEKTSCKMTSSDDDPPKSRDNQ
jgi:hypothetical protein